MFTYETERMIRKQHKFVKSKAYAIIQDLEAKSLSDEEAIKCISTLLNNPDNTETQKDVLNYAKKIIESRLAIKTEETDIELEKAAKLAVSSKKLMNKIINKSN